MPIEAQLRVVRKHVERDRWGIETIITLAEEGGRLHLDDPGRYSRDWITSFTASPLDSVRG
jgi:hypothetical protein